MSINRDPPIEKRVFVRAFRQIIYELIYIYIGWPAERVVYYRERGREKKEQFSRLTAPAR